MFEGDKVQVKKGEYGGEIVTINSIQYNYFGNAEHRYWVLLRGRNIAFRKSQLKEVNYNILNQEVK